VSQAILSLLSVPPPPSASCLCLPRRHPWGLLAAYLQQNLSFSRNTTDRSRATVAGQRPDFLAYLGNALVLKASCKGSLQVNLQACSCSSS
jgi:hypothetical protein